MLFLWYGALKAAIAPLFSRCCGVPLVWLSMLSKVVADGETHTYCRCTILCFWLTTAVTIQTLVLILLQSGRKKALSQCLPKINLVPSNRKIMGIVHSL